LEIAKNGPELKAALTVIILLYGALRVYFQTS